ncbi:MAG: hypothetical protein EOO53_20415 [Gammaproteobacteria bacterium]|nr:MAG: hypothetical protein EOO53_20415 [Gammaproteobacteria bacterium]
MRSRELCEFEKRISEINNRLSHFNFISKQFLLDNEKRLQNNLKKDVPEVYLENPCASQFNINIGEVEDKAIETTNYLLDTVFVFANTQFEVYLLDVYNFVRNNFDNSLPEPPDSKIYQTILEGLNVDIENDIENLFSSSYEYFKLRRNAIMHRKTEKRFQGALELLVTGQFRNDPDKLKLFRKSQLNGQELNREWKSYTKSIDDKNIRSYTIRNLSFTNRELSHFTFSELTDFLNFLRLYAKMIDFAILSKIERKKLVEYCLGKYDSYYLRDHTKDSAEKFRSSFTRISRIELNLQLTEEEILSHQKGV